MEKIIEGVKGLIDIELKSIDEEKSIAEVYISSSKRDRMGDIVEPDAIINGSKNFMKQPVLLDGHDSRGGVERILGKFLEIYKVGEKVAAKVQYLAGQGNSAADWAFTLAKNGVAAFSIGFRGLAYELIEERDADGYKHVTGYKFTKIELLEVSQVAIPANPDAVMKAYQSFSKSEMAHAPQVSDEGKTAPVPQEKKYTGTELMAKFAEFLKSETKEN